MNPRRPKPARRSPADRVFTTMLLVVMVLVLIATLYPFWYILVLSFNEGADAARGGVYLWPRVFSLMNYHAVFQNPSLVSGFQVTILRTVIGTVSHVLFTAMVAFALSHRGLKGRKAYMFFGSITMFLSAGLIPYYMTMLNLGLRDTFWMYIIPSLFSFYDCILFITFFRGIPEEIYESAQIDGAGYWRIFVQIVLPLSGAILATLALFTGVYHWNDYFVAVLYIDQKELLPIQTILYKIVAEAQASTMLTQVNLPDVVSRRTLTSESIKMATMVVTTLPIICVYPFLQKYFVKGIMIGSVKG